MTEQEERLRAAIEELAERGKAPCRRLLELAGQTGASPREIGRLCNEMKIKIIACQLGCFK